MAQLRRMCLWAVVPLVLLFVAGIVFVPKEAASDASGCTRFEHSKPSWNQCQQAAGQVCYYCEYTYTAGGYSICYENESGGVRYCTDYQY